MAQTKVKEGLIDATLGGVTWDSTAKTANFTAAAGSGYLVDTSSSAITVTLPSSPSFGDEIIIIDYKGNAATNNITLGRNSLNIQGTASDYAINDNNESVRLLYSDATQGWIITSDAGAVIEGAPDLNVDYLVVAGGGGGGVCVAGTANGGGGGAGGLRSSYGNTMGGGQAAETSLSLNVATNYTVTIGSGGNGAATENTTGSLGQDSVFSTITSKGGGGGGGNQSAATSGGSGGGGAESDRAGAAAVTSPVIHGYAGGTGSESGNRGGGGGGAGSAGSGGTGGNGLAVGITGSSVTYAAGGAAVSGSSNPSSHASANTGDGGRSGASSAGNGGSGIVILRYPDYYNITVGSGLTTGTLNTTVGSSDKYTTFTAGTGSITFGAA